MFDRRTHACACREMNNYFWTYPFHYLAELLLIADVDRIELKRSRPAHIGKVGLLPIG